MAFHTGMNFTAIPLDVKYGWIAGQPGSAAVQPAIRTLRDSESGLRVASLETTKRMSELGFVWQGPAATVARSSLDGAQAGMQSTSSAAANGAAQLQAYGESFDRTRSLIEGLNPEPPGIFASGVRNLRGLIANPVIGLGGATLDYVLSLERNQRHSEEADRALQQHLDTTSDVDTRFLAVEPAASGPSGSGGAVGGPAPSGVSLGSVGAVPDKGAVPSLTPATIGDGPGGTTGGGSTPGYGTAGAAGSGGPAGGTGTGTGTVGAGGSFGGAVGGGVARPADSRYPGVQGPHHLPALPGPGRAATPRIPFTDPGAARADLARQFGDRARQQQLLPSSGHSRGGPGVDDRHGAGPGRTSARVGDLRAPGPRSGPEALPARSADPLRSAERAGHPGYGPTAGGAAAARDSQDHRNRYVVPCDEVGDVGIVATDAVLGPDDSGERR